MIVNVIGAGLAGSEAAYQLIKRGISVRLYEMRPKKSTPAHKTGGFCELVCSNSLRSKDIANAVGLLKEEMQILDSLVMKAAIASEVPSGGSLAVDRELFSSYITNYLKNHGLVEVINEEAISIPEGPTIICAGPLASEELSKAIKEFVGEDYLYFFDAVAPIVTSESINTNVAYLKSRYDKGEAAYFNCPMTEDEFNKFYDYLINADRVVPKEFELKVFEGCMAIEDMAARGRQTLLFGPMKPVGLKDPKTGITPYAVVQLRQDDASKSTYNLVGFQTHLTWPAQKELLHLIPGLEKAEIVRYGVMHKNTFINGPKVLNKYYQTIKREDLFFAGQITGVEGYIESAASGMVAGINMAHYLQGKDMIDFSQITALGALQYHVSTLTSDYQPMNVNYSLFIPINVHAKKSIRKQMYAKRSLDFISEIKEQIC